jgi:hypothetical protein
MNLSTKIRGGILLANAFKEKGVEHVFTLRWRILQSLLSKALWNVKCLLLIALMSK